MQHRGPPYVYKPPYEITNIYGTIAHLEVLESYSRVALVAHIVLHLE